MKAWFKAHAKQLATIALWLAAMVALHRWPQFHGDVELLSGALLLVGIQLPPFTLKAGAQAAAKIVGGVLLVLVTLGALVLACSAQVTAKDAYYYESKACVDAFTVRADQDECLRRLRAKWDEAGAPPSASNAVPVDGGKVGDR